MASPLVQARTAFQKRQYKQVIAILRPALYPSSRLATEAQEVEAYKLLGISYFWQSRLATLVKDRKRLEGLAAQQYSALLSLRPKTRLSRLLHPKHVVDFYEKVRKKLQAGTSRRKALEEELKHCRKQVKKGQKRFDAYRRKCKTRTVVTVHRKKRYLFWSFVPFGAGQFQNQQSTKGALFAAGQGAMALMNVTAFILAETTFVRKSSGGPLKDGEKYKQRARDLQNIQIASGVIFWALVVWGIVDALVYYKKSTTIRTRQLIPIGDGGVDLTPVVGRDRVLLGVGARF